MTRLPPAPSPGYDRPRTRGARRTLLGILLVALACGPGEDHDTAPSEDRTAAPAAEPAPDTATGASEDAVSRLVDFRPTTPEAAGGVFAHGPHGVVGCARCHPAPAGHTTHPSVECLLCHGDPAARTPVSPDSDCSACHHAPDQELGCAGCHAGIGARPSASLPRPLAVAGTEHVRPLPFLHARHPSVACASCHGPGAAVTQDVECASCHEEHHRPEADCAACHEAPPETAHDRETHRGCSGSGCHVDASVPDLQGGRPVCLSCHVELRDHKEGRPCAPCHQLAAVPGGAP